MASRFHIFAQCDLQANTQCCCLFTIKFGVTSFSTEIKRGGSNCVTEHIINGFTLRLVLADMLQKGLRFITHPEVRIGVPLFFYVGPTTSAVGAIRCCDGKKNT